MQSLTCGMELSSSTDAEYNVHINSDVHHHHHYNMAGSTEAESQRGLHNELRERTLL